MELTNILLNKTLIAALLGWFIAQAVKVPLEFITHRRWNWSLLLRAGGMPSSHSALVSGLALALGLYYGFDSPYFAIGFILCMVVIYDATGIRRQAGRHARIINRMIIDLTFGHPLKQEELREVLGHSPMEALVGTLLGIVCALALWLIWP
jgi:acid phosphatase family membrane protein YuiD